MEPAAHVFSVHDVDWDGEEGLALRLAQRMEIESRYGGDTEPGTAPTAGDVAVFLVARDASGAAVACGGLRDLAAGVAEIKRMYAVPAVRGTGAAVAVLRRLEERARQRGVQDLRLETGTGQPDAIRFYEREGYHRIPNFGVYVGEPLSVCYARDLG